MLLSLSLPTLWLGLKGLSPSLGSTVSPTQTNYDVQAAACNNRGFTGLIFTFGEVNESCAFDYGSARVSTKKENLGK